MSKFSNQKLKILYLRKILLENTDENNYISMEKILKLLESYDINAERKSIYADIEALNTFGMDINLRKGKYSGYAVLNRDFELAELKLLIDSVQSSKFLTKRKSEALIKKIENLTSKHYSKSLQRQVFVSDRIKNENESIYYNVDTIHTALSTNKKIVFYYFEWVIDKTQTNNIKRQHKRNNNKYEVNPWCLTYADEKYYLIAFDETSNKIKHFRVDKMEFIDVLEQERVGRELFSDFNISDYTNKIFSMYGGEETRVKLEFDNSVLGVVIDKFSSDILIKPDNVNRFQIDVDVIVSSQFFSFIFGLGEKAKIISPKTVIKQYKKHCKKALSNYQ